MSLIVESNARFGMMGEHSPVDALIPSIIADHAISEPMDETEFSNDAKASETSDTIERLDWTADSRILSECNASQTRSLAIINNSDPDVLRFNDYGIRWIKDSGQSSLRFESLVLWLTTSAPHYQLDYLQTLIFKWRFNSRGTRRSAHLRQLTKLLRLDCSFMDEPKLLEL